MHLSRDQFKPSYDKLEPRGLLAGLVEPGRDTEARSMEASIVIAK